MLFQGFPTQAEAIYGRCPNPLGPTFGNQKRSTMDEWLLTSSRQASLRTRQIFGRGRTPYHPMELLSSSMILPHGLR